MVPILKSRLLRLFVSIFLILTIVGVSASAGQWTGEKSAFLLEEKSSDSEECRSEWDAFDCALQNPTNICWVFPIYAIRSIEDLVDAKSALLCPHLQRGPPSK